MKFKDKEEVHEYLKNNKINAGSKNKEIQKVLYEYGFHCFGWKSIFDVSSYLLILPFLYIDGEYIQPFDSIGLFYKLSCNELSIDDILSIEIEMTKKNKKEIASIIEQCSQNIIDEHVDPSLINYSEDNYEAGKLEGIRLTVEQAFHAGVEWIKSNES